MPMSKPRPFSLAIKPAWRLINLVSLTIAFVIPVVHDRALGIVSYLEMLFALLLFLPGVLFQAVTIPGKFPGLLLYLAGLSSLLSIVLYVVLGIIAFGFSFRKTKQRILLALLFITLGGMGAIAVLFLWQGHLTYGAWLMVAALISCLILELIEWGSAKPKNR